MKFKLSALLIVLALILVSATAFPVKADQTAVNLDSASCCRTVKLFDVDDVKILTVETDLTPVHTFRLPGGPTLVVNGWGWLYSLEADWPSSENAMVEPLNIAVSHGKAAFRQWTGWGIPGNIVQIPIDFGGPKTTLHTYGLTVDGGRVIRAYVNIWSANERIYLRTGQVAVGEMVPADENFYREISTPDLTKSVNLNKDLVNGGTISDVHVSKVAQYSNNSGWVISEWKADRITVTTNGGAKVVLNASANLLEPNPSIDDAWYSKRFKEVWNPARLVGLNVCPYTDLIPAIQTLYLWDGSCE